LILWDKDGILRIDYLPKGQTINAEYYSSLLVQLKETLMEIHHENITNLVLFFHENAPTPWALATQKKLSYLGFQFLDHPPLFSESGPVALPPAPGTEKQLKNRHFLSDTEVIAAAGTWLDGQTLEFFLSGLQKVEQLAKKCIELRGEYTE
jgi:hypothetical protein